MEHLMAILYVDDEPINLELIRIIFKKTFTVYTTETAQEGIAILNSHSEIKVVISDMKMPGMDGIEFSKEVRELFPNIVFIILTGYDISSEISEALKLGYIDKYFCKPFNKNVIERTIRDYFEKQG